MTENRGQKNEFGSWTRRRPIERDYVAARCGSRKFSFNPPLSNIYFKFCTLYHEYFA